MDGLLFALTMSTVVALFAWVIFKCLDALMKGRLW